MHEREDQRPFDGWIRIFNILQNPSATMTFLMAIFGHHFYTGDKFDPFKLFSGILMLMSASCMLYVIVRQFSYIYHMIFMCVLCALVSILATGWCINNADTCAMYFTNTNSIVERILMAFGDIILHSFNIITANATSTPVAAK